MNFIIAHGSRGCTLPCPILRAQCTSSAKAEEIINSRKYPGFMPVDAGIHYALVGAKDKTKQTLDELRRMGLLDGLAPSGNMYLAMAHGLIGEYDECFRLLNLACDNHIQLEAMQIWRLEPAFEPVRRDSRFTES